MTTSRSILLTIRDVSDKDYRENQNTYFRLKNFFFLIENRVVCKIMWKNMIELGRPQMTIWCIRFTCWISKATNIHSESVIIVHFSTVTMVARTRLDVTLYVHCTSRMCHFTCKFDFSEPFFFVSQNSISRSIELCIRLMCSTATCN